MKSKIISKIKFIITILIIILFIWFLIINPIIIFKTYENKFKNSAIEYFDTHKELLPKDDEVSIVNLKTLYDENYIKENLTIPYTKESCNKKTSWVKVKQKNGKYKYYTYLKCGEIESITDNKGPEITLNGQKAITINIGDKYQELGIKNVIDNYDGKINKEKVSITNNIDTTKTGIYEVTYEVEDSLKNKTIIKRKVEVVSELKKAVIKNTNSKGYYIGVNPQNYLKLSGMLFRIIGIDGDNIKIVASEDVANVNYEGIYPWLNYYLEHFDEKSKKLLVKNRYCNMRLTDTTIDTTECTLFTKKIYAYLPSVIDINRTTDNTGCFLKTSTISWLSNDKNKNYAYVTRDIFYGNLYGTSIHSDKKINNYGVRPVLTIKGNSIIKDGDGSYERPYILNDTTEAKENDKVNTRPTGEYITYSNILWRIIEKTTDGATKIISVENIVNKQDFVKIAYETETEKKLYNPEEKGNIGYYINNDISKIIDTKYLVEKTISVPIYEDHILYDKHKKIEKYKVILSAPNMYDMFSSHTTLDNMKSYWLINSSNKQYYKGVVSDIGVALSEEVSNYEKYGIRLIAYLDKDTIIKEGTGTKNNPYSVTK